MKNLPGRVLALLLITGILLLVGLVSVFSLLRPSIQSSDQSRTVAEIRGHLERAIVSLDLFDHPDLARDLVMAYKGHPLVRRLSLINRKSLRIASTEPGRDNQLESSERVRQALERGQSYSWPTEQDGVSLVEITAPVRSGHPETGPIQGAIVLAVPGVGGPDLVAREMPGGVTTGALFMIALCLLVVIFYLQRFFATLGRLSGTALNLAAGKIDERIPIEPNSEFEMLASSMNQIADTLGSRIKEREKLNTELTLSNREKENSLRMLSQMAGSMAHEIRNPLAGIRGISELLAGEFPKEDKRATYARMIQDEVKKLEAVVQNMLDFARPKPPRFEKTVIDSVFDSVLLAVQPTIDAARKRGRNIQITLGVENEAQLIEGDATMLRQLFLNLIQNAVEAMADQKNVPGDPTNVGILVVNGERITRRVAVDRHGIETRGEADVVAVTLADNGPGMPANVVGSLFTPFFTTKASGTGLGLSISKKIAENHGGDIIVQSTPGSGTRFTVLLPISQPVTPGN